MAGKIQLTNYLKQLIQNLKRIMKQINIYIISIKNLNLLKIKINNK